MKIKKNRIMCMAAKCPYLEYCDNQKQKGFCMRPECPHDARIATEKEVTYQEKNRADEIIKKIYEPDLHKLGIPLP